MIGFGSFTLYFPESTNYFASKAHKFNVVMKPKSHGNCDLHYFGSINGGYLEAFSVPYKRGGINGEDLIDIPILASKKRAY